MENSLLPRDTNVVHNSYCDSCGKYETNLFLLPISIKQIHPSNIDRRVQVCSNCGFNIRQEMERNSVKETVKIV